ncbi:hypothetical protein EG329_005457 [Mollisiaceae sp. DMI_Dod_QoI]|nr:hypothetical protein EG329_005457 [Helotiales sp. DMI_Dod_QoI]
MDSEVEGQTALTNSPSHPPGEASSPTAVHFCSLCDKPFINACRACNAAKIKCSFETPCSRCVKKSIECVYGRAAPKGKRTFPTTPSSGAAPIDKIVLDARPPSSSDPSTSLAPPWSFHEDDGILSNVNVAFGDHSAMPVDDAQLQLQSVSRAGHPSVDLSTQTFPLNESFTLDELLAFEDYSSGQLQCLTDVPVDPGYKLKRQSPSWCSWTAGGVSLSVVTENPIAGLDSNPLEILQTERPHAQHNANLVIQSLRSLPTMMLRRETFPWFIHPHSQLLSKPPSTTLPEALSTCMSIAQMFASRTLETKSFLWCTIRAEYRRFITEKPHLSISELLAALQACMIYLIMCIIDRSPESEETSLELLMALHARSWFYPEFKS